MSDEAAEIRKDLAFPFTHPDEFDDIWKAWHELQEKLYAVVEKTNDAEIVYKASMPCLAQTLAWMLSNAYRIEAITEVERDEFIFNEFRHLSIVVSAHLGEGKNCEDTALDTIQDAERLPG